MRALALVCLLSLVLGGAAAQTHDHADDVAGSVCVLGTLARGWSEPTLPRWDFIPSVAVELPRAGLAVVPGEPIPCLGRAPKQGPPA